MVVAAVVVVVVGIVGGMGGEEELNSCRVSKACQSPYSLNIEVCL